MSDTILNDGGPAFPIPPQVFDDGVQQVSQQGAPGMSLRDWFAGQALAGNCGFSLTADGVTSDQLAEEAYAIAETMMAERERRYGKQPEPEAEVEGAAF
jgi:hypothetical protein